ncbi:retrovirus-related pol polyprotein from transposon TNT 1-94 [Tanacetum coccineum]
MEPYYIQCIKDGPFKPKTTEGADKPDFKGPSNTKENRIKDLKLEYQTFRAKPSESLLQTYTRYKTLLNELTNDGVTLSKHEINVDFVNSLPEKWLSFSQGLRNANHTQTLDLVDIYGSIVQDFQENANDEADERSSEKYLRDIDVKLLFSVKMFSTQVTLKLIQSSQHAQSSQSEPKFQKDYKAEYKKLKAKLTLLEASPSTSQSPKPFQSKNKGLVLMALADDELFVGKNHAHNGEWINITMKKRHIREPIWYLDSRCSRSMTGVKSYLHKYIEQPGPKVVFGDNSSYITEGYGLINYGGIVFSKVAFVNGLKYNLISISQLCDAKYIVQFDDKQRTIFNANKEIMLIALRRNNVYVLDMSSLTPNGACFFAKASESVNWLWHKRLSHLNFKNITKLAKQNKVLSLPSLVYSKDKPCSTCERGKHKKASFKTK